MLQCPNTTKASSSEDTDVNPEEAGADIITDFTVVFFTRTVSVLKASTTPFLIFAETSCLYSRALQKISKARKHYKAH